MKNKTTTKIASIIALVALVVPASLQARLGENIAETDKRYGKPKFTHTEGNMAYRNYTFKEKDIEVIFSDDEAVFEFINFGPYEIYDGSQAQQIGAQNGEFILAIMTAAYEWPEEKVAELLTNLGMQGQEMASQLEHEGVTAKYYINAVKLQLHNIYEGGLRLNSKKVEDEEVRNAAGAIMQAAYEAKQKAKNKSKAGGF